MLTSLFTNTLNRPTSLPILGDVLQDLCSWLQTQGYPPSAIERRIEAAPLLEECLRQRQIRSLFGRTAKELRACWPRQKGWTSQVACALGRSLLKYLEHRGDLAAEPTTPSDRLIRDYCEHLEGHEIGAMLEAVSSSQRRDHVRDRALLLMLFNTGARVQELLDIRMVDLQLDRPTFVRLRGKGRKERLCPLWPETVTAVRTLLHISHVPAEDSKPIFRNHRGEPMTRFGVRYLIRQYAERARATAPTLAAKRVHPHTCRHSAAVHLLRAGVDLVTISHWLGHASVETTNRYAAIDLETKRKALERAGPVTGATTSAVTTWRTDASVLEWLEAL